jgi:hypothetical protein
MKTANMRNGFIMVTLLALSAALSGHGNYALIGTQPAFAASAQEKAEARNDLNVVMASLRSVDTAYTSGNAAEAQTKFAEARATWNKIAPKITAREAREAQLLFDSLGKKLQANAPATEVKSTVSGMLEEFREDIARELR